MTIKPIETYYNGYRFRSRSEARWAVLLDTIGMKYIYEMEGFDLGGGVRYLPDFYLPDAKQFFEVKADINNISMEDRIKICKLADATGKYVIVGDSRFRLVGSEPKSRCGGYTIEREHPGEFITCDTYLVRCKNCNTLYFENEMAYTCTACGDYSGDSTFEYVSGIGGSIDNATAEWVEAILEAKWARFEHEESQRPKRWYPKRKGQWSRKKRWASY